MSSTPHASSFSRLAQLAGGSAKKPADEIEKRLAALEARVSKAADEECDDEDDKKSKKNKSKEKDEGDGDEGDNDDRPNTDKKKGDDGDPNASITTTGSIVPYSAAKMKADKATAAAIIEAGNKRRGEKA
jgi:hypothetical protein